MKMKKTFLLSFSAMALLASCEVQDNSENVLEQQKVVAGDIMDHMITLDIDLPKGMKGLSNKNGQNFQAEVSQFNKLLIPYGIQLEKMEYYSAEAVGKTVFFSDRGNKQLTSDFVPNDPRNVGGETVPYIIDGTQLETSSGLNTLNALNSVMSTWDAVTCSDGLTLPNGGVTPVDFGLVSFLEGFSSAPNFIQGAILHAGILPPAFFDAIAPDGGDFILGVCFTFSYLEDINQDGKGDVAIKEIYYNDGFNWQDEPNDVIGNGIYDFETVALHETGHALSQAHFGEAFTNSSGKLKFAPYALMNAGYTITRRSVEKTDESGHCSNWGDWPNN